jgi:hypothetical protein
MKALLIGVFIALFLLFLWHKRKNIDGFENYLTGSPLSEFNSGKPRDDLYSSLFGKRLGNVPTSKQGSSIPTDTPGASTNNPMMSIPQTRDLKALRENINNFIKLSETTPKMNLLDTQRVTITTLDNKSRDIMPQIDMWIANPENSNMNVSDIASLRQKYEEGINILRNTPASTNKVQQNQKIVQKLPITTVATDPHKITLVALRNLRDRIHEEIKKLNQLRSTSPTILQRRTQLERIMADINNYISSVERKTMKIEDVPILQDDADSFLKSINNLTKPLPNLVKPVAVPTSAPAPAMNAPAMNAPAMNAPAMNAPAMNAPAMNAPATNAAPMAAIQPLLEMAKFLKWNLNIDVAYDPELAQREKFMKRIEDMETRLTNMMISETPIPPKMFEMYIQELNLLKSVIEKNNNRGDTNTPRHNRVEIKPSQPSGAEYPSINDLDKAQGKDFGTQRGNLPNGEGTANVYVRPGVIMTADDIQNRGSMAAFDPSMVGGSDYKKRALDLCRQVKGADLGAASSFGCIDDPNIVSQTYSWKGNYEMVCRRLGDTWGAWYPEMFGCPKYDPTAKFSGRT